ncbi:kallikrein-9-like [Schistocerca americana]|uniref:kallikrein-9-like n=1 Tax=Schistocerca americana TaxID=7009 RepID=UPI001F500DCE|nr:kallikrein-9-like [Schistocerca americana]
MGAQVSGSLLGTYARPVGLPLEGFDPEEGLNVTVTGRGDRSTSGLEAGNLRKAGRGVCRGDYGGPLVSGATQLGIASWSASPCEATPAVFTSVGHLRSWIRATACV